MNNLTTDLFPYFTSPANETVANSGSVPLNEWVRIYDENGLLILPYCSDPVAAEIAEEQIILLTDAFHALVDADSLDREGWSAEAIARIDRIAISSLLSGIDLAAFEILGGDEEETDEAEEVVDAQ